jgi:hypothetical protein
VICDSSWTSLLHHCHFIRASQLTQPHPPAPSQPCLYTYHHNATIIWHSCLCKCYTITINSVPTHYYHHHHYLCSTNIIMFAHQLTALTWLL